MSPEQQFAQERAERIRAYGGNSAFQALSQQWLQASMTGKYVYNFDWLGRPIIQYPQDMWVVQDLIWRIRPDLVIETGVAHGGSLVLSASMLALLDLCEAIESGKILDPSASQRKVLGIDIDIRAHNRAAIEAHPMASRIQLIQGSSIASDVIHQVHEVAKNYSRVLVFLDSMHTHDHVLAELEAYAPLVTAGSYCVVFDTLIEDLPKGFFADRPWDVGDNPKTAVHAFLQQNHDFEIDSDQTTRLLVTVAPDGFLRRRS
ncbi:Cephalosporin hydroxylase [gamma proteobacterium HdN1]|nr:Cephalosporin hydroxylase [gamma proteobacterium HdN1]